MKLKHSLYVISAAALSLAGCSKYLETKTPDRFTDDVYWSSEANVRAYNWEFYNLFTGFGTGTTGDFYFSTFSDDQATTGLSVYPASAAATNGNWDWTLIRKANIMIKRVETVPMSDEAKKHWTAVARFFRAFDYFGKVKLFGDVPWIGTPLDISDTAAIYKPRDPRKLVMDSVLADINFAIDNLRATDLDNTVNKNVALAFKSRVCLFEGTYRKYHTEVGLNDADVWLAACKDASEKVMTAGYVLGANYKDIYSSMSLTGNKEVILYKVYVAGGMTHSVIGYTNSTTQMSGLTKSAVESYAATDGLPITLSPLYQGDADIKTLRMNRDKRLLQTVDTFLAYNGTLVGGLSSSTGYRPSKFLNPASNQLAPNNETDAPLFYLGEILLNYAEAVAELDQLGKYTVTNADLDKSVNLLRMRAGIAKLETQGGQTVAVNGTAFADPKKDADVTPLIWEIRRERRVELMMDGFRYQDLMRWKKGAYMDNAKNPDIFLGAKVPDNGKVLRNANGYIMTYTAGTNRPFIDPRHYLSAIPTGQISLYPAGMLKQNPGWEQ
ncbi:MAG: RagB/SusD family nutrient uptake outer membrane protein [Niastella sp.]|nr:RagB/SusD family nutrient uptake outer membrane protein [Niastella sp.]